MKTYQHIDECEECGHPWSNHYDTMYCLEDGCCCGPCHLCGTQYVEQPVNNGACINCKVLADAVKNLLENT